jgi:hypothetical protein
MLRVFPDDIMQINQHTEIVSFVCESFVNLDGRCDINRYVIDSTYSTPENYSLNNSVYSQKNNYFSYSAISNELFNSNNFINSIAWSRVKKSG